MPGCSFSKVLPRAVKLSFSEAAANTVTVPDGFFEDEPESDSLEESSESPEEQAVSAMVASAKPPTAR
ncbi:hypothetical protein GCM10017744_051600 [Streptomyces antimycoticus]|uniref:Uncharacterized protein n=1 Tax=Streptomyces antimycoticus TaxID=68175 RepID=A0A4D4KBV5_9ACTN|nr:hypothetical protein SANT12839_050680 [Streptomyces antimycoticus]